MAKEQKKIRLNRKRQWKLWKPRLRRWWCLRWGKGMGVTRSKMFANAYVNCLSRKLNAEKHALTDARGCHAHTFFGSFHLAPSFDMLNSVSTLSSAPQPLLFAERHLRTPDGACYILPLRMVSMGIRPFSTRLTATIYFIKTYIKKKSFNYLRIFPLLRCSRVQSPWC